MNSSKPSLLRGLAVGATAGIIATVIMGGFQSLSASGEKALEKRRKLAEGESPWDIAHEQIQQEQQAASQEGSTEIELAVPALRLAPPPTETAPKAHFEHWIAHVVYGGDLPIAPSPGALKRVPGRANRLTSLCSANPLLRRLDSVESFIG